MTNETIFHVYSLTSLTSDEVNLVVTTLLQKPCSKL